MTKHLALGFGSSTSLEQTIGIQQRLYRPSAVAPEVLMPIGPVGCPCGRRSVLGGLSGPPRADVRAV